MRLCILSLFVLSLFAAPLSAQEKKDAAPAKFFFESESQGWSDLLDKDLKTWKRVSIPPGKKLAEKNPWQVSEDGKLLVCNGVGVHEMLLFDKELADGIFHVEWKFTAVEGKKGYNSGVYARNSADGDIWHQAQVGASGVGGLFGKTLDNGAGKSFNSGRKGPERGKGPGEWNTYEIVCKGKNLSLWVNGYLTTDWSDCQVPKGYIGVEAEGWLIEFRNVKWKEIK